jgi:hypothetical protein
VIPDRTDLGLVSAALTAVCVIPYLRDVYRGTTRPQRTSWLVFSVLAVVAAISQGIAETGPGVWLAAGSAVGFTAVFVASIRRGVGGTSALDIAALGVTVVGIVLGFILEQPLVAVGSVIVAELAAVALTARKAIADPASETRSTWLIDCIAGLVAIIAIPELSLAALLYPVHHTLANAGVLTAIIVGRRRRPRVVAATR